MGTDEVAEEECVIETKLADLDADPGCQVVVPIADAQCQRFADMILSTEMRLPTITLLPLIREDECSTKNVVIGICYTDIPICWN